MWNEGSLLYFKTIPLMNLWDLKQSQNLIQVYNSYCRNAPTNTLGFWYYKYIKLILDCCGVCSRYTEKFKYKGFMCSSTHVHYIHQNWRLELIIDVFTIILTNPTCQIKLSDTPHWNFNTKYARSPASDFIFCDHKYVSRNVHIYLIIKQKQK